MCSEGGTYGVVNGVGLLDVCHNEVIKTTLRTRGDVGRSLRRLVLQTLDSLEVVLALGNRQVTPISTSVLA